MMNDHWQKLCDELRPGLGAIHRQTQVLKARQAEAKVRALAGSDRRLGKSLLFILTPLFGLLAAGGLLYGEGDALFIDKDGNASFSAKVQVPGNQQIKFTDTDTSNNLRLQLWSGFGLGINGSTLFYAANGRHSWRDSNGTNERMALTTAADGGLAVLGTGNSSFAGNLGIGLGSASPGAKLDVAGTTRLGKGVAESWFPYTDNNAYISGNQTIIRSGSSGSHTEFVRIDEKGNVGIGTKSLTDKLEVAGALRVLNGSNPIRFTSGWSGFPDETGKTNQAEISNDTGTYKSLMIVGNKSGGGTTRRVQVYDQLEVKGPLYVSGALAYYWGPDRQWKHIENRAGDWAGSYNSAAPTSSDLRLKSELRSIPSALDKVTNLRAVTYRWNEAALRYFTRDIDTTISAGPNATAEENQKVWQAERARRYKQLANTQVGVVAQDVEAVLPEAVVTDAAGYKSVRYDYLIPLLIEALKEQHKTVKDQAQIVAQQQQEIARLAAANLTSQRQLADLSAVRAQVASLEAAVRRVTADQAGGARQAVAHLSGTKAK
jgi:hypothetical protein